MDTLVQLPNSMRHSVETFDERVSLAQIDERATDEASDVWILNPFEPLSPCSAHETNSPMSPNPSPASRIVREAYEHLVNALGNRGDLPSDTARLLAATFPNAVEKAYSFCRGGPDGPGPPLCRT
jgi:hypothetical protein